MWKCTNNFIGVKNWNWLFVSIFEFFNLLNFLLLIGNEMLVGKESLLQVSDFFGYLNVVSVKQLVQLFVQLMIFIPDVEDGLFLSIKLKHFRNQNFFPAFVRGYISDFAVLMTIMYGVFRFCLLPKLWFKVVKKFLKVIAL